MSQCTRFSFWLPQNLKNWTGNQGFMQNIQWEKLRTASYISIHSLPASPVVLIHPFHNLGSALLDTMRLGRFNQLTVYFLMGTDPSHCYEWRSPRVAASRRFQVTEGQSFKAASWCRSLSFLCCFAQRGNGQWKFHSVLHRLFLPAKMERPTSSRGPSNVTSWQFFSALHSSCVRTHCFASIRSAQWGANLLFCVVPLCVSGRAIPECRVQLNIFVNPIIIILLSSSSEFPLQLLLSPMFNILSLCLFPSPKHFRLVDTLVMLSLATRVALRYFDSMRPWKMKTVNNMVPLLILLCIPAQQSFINSIDFHPQNVLHSTKLVLWW